MSLRFLSLRLLTIYNRIDSELHSQSVNCIHDSQRMPVDLLKIIIIYLNPQELLYPIIVGLTNNIRSWLINSKILIHSVNIGTGSSC